MDIWTLMQTGTVTHAPEALIRQCCQFVFYSLLNPQPVKTDEHISYMVAGSHTIDKSSRHIQDRPTLVKHLLFGNSHNCDFCL